MNSCKYSIIELESFTTPSLDEVRFISVKLIEDWIKLWWNKINEQRRIAVKEMIKNLHIGADKFESSRPIRNKISNLISEIAKRLFPQCWTTFFIDIVGIWAQGSPPVSEVLLENFAIIFTNRYF